MKILARDLLLSILFIKEPAFLLPSLPKERASREDVFPGFSPLDFAANLGFCHCSSLEDWESGPGLTLTALASPDLSIGSG